MKARLSKFIMTTVLLVFALALGGCRTAPILNISEAPVTVVGSEITKDDVRKAIVSAGSSLGWQMKDVDDNTIVATLFLRTHMAQVTIKYSVKSYSIMYKDSQNLKYDGSMIHNNYNGWIQNLDKAIQVRISGI